MSRLDLIFLESASNLKPLIKKSIGREPSTRIVREIAVCIKQGRLFYEAAGSSPIEIRPLQIFYGMIAFAKALIIARNLKPLETLPQSHGLRDISAQNSRLEELKIKIGNRGTFTELNDTASPLSRICYFERSTPLYKTISASPSVDLAGKELNIRDIISRIPGLEDLYRQTFNEEPNTSQFNINLHDKYKHCEIRVDTTESFVNRASLREIVMGLRYRYPFLQRWCFQSATHAWGYSVLIFNNVDKTNIEEFHESYLQEIDGAFQTFHSFNTDGSVQRTEFNKLLEPPLGGYSGHASMVAPFEGVYISDFSLYYLGMFLLSSLVRYRPQTWGHAISRSVTEENAADDRVLALIEGFMDIAFERFPSMIAKVVNIFEDRYRATNTSL